MSGEAPDGAGELDPAQTMTVIQNLGTMGVLGPRVMEQLPEDDAALSRIAASGQEILAASGLEIPLDLDGLHEKPLPDRGVATLSRLMDVPPEQLKALHITAAQAGAYMTRLSLYQERQLEKSSDETTITSNTVLHLSGQGYSDNAIRRTLAYPPSNAVDPMSLIRTARYRAIKTLHESRFPASRLRDGLTQFLNPAQADMWQAAENGGSGMTAGLGLEDPAYVHALRFVERITGRPAPAKLTQQQAVTFAERIMLDAAGAGAAVPEPYTKLVRYIRNGELSGPTFLDRKAENKARSRLILSLPRLGVTSNRAYNHLQQVMDEDGLNGTETDRP